jgi:signal transduction histidine kinase
LLVALPVLRAALNGLGLGAPAGLAAFTAAHGLGVLAAAALRPDAPHAWLLLLAAPVSMGMFLYLAGVSGRLARGRALVAAQGAALQAQLVVERASQHQASTATLGELRQRRHDARSALSTARLAADRIAPFLRGDPARWPLVQELIGALDALQRLVAEQRTPRDAATGPALERVEVEPVVRAVLESVRERAPVLRASVEVAPGALAARVRGGSVALYQILEQLATNAAEGDGARRARHVGVAVLCDELAGSLAIRIADDGPGFRPRLLEQPIAPFVTTKPHGVGLGLYTAERLACASGGSLRLENRPEGGAVVTVYLELAADPAAASSPAKEPACARSGSSIASYS